MDGDFRPADGQDVGTMSTHTTTDSLLGLQMDHPQSAMLEVSVLYCRIEVEQKMNQETELNG